MSQYSTLTVPTQHVDVNGTKFAYRRFGKTGSLPLVFFNYFTGNLDNWDPSLLDPLAQDRDLIIFNNKGVAGSEGIPPCTIQETAKDARDFIAALGLKKIDILGFSMGSYVAQQVAIDQPELINRVILAGSGPRGGEGLETFSPEIWALFEKQYNAPDELLLDVFFSQTTSSQKAGWDYLNRIRSRTEKDSAHSEQVIPAQVAAIGEWGKKREGSFDYLKELPHPVLLLSGKNDLVFPTVNAFILQQHLADAKLVIYPDSNHGSIYQFQEDIVFQVNTFLNK